MNYYNRGKIYYYLGEYDNAESELAKALEEGEIAAKLCLGQIYEEKEDYDSAVGSYTEYLAENDQDGMAWNQLGLCQLKKADYESALISFQNSINAEENQVLYEACLLYTSRCV